MIITITADISKSNTPKMTRDEMDYYDAICDAINEEFYWDNEKWINSESCELWIEKLMSKKVSPEYAARIIERAFNMFIKEDD